MVGFRLLCESLGYFETVLQADSSNFYLTMVKSTTIRKTPISHHIHIASNSHNTKAPPSSS